MVLHALAGKFEVLRFPLIMLRPVDQLDDVVDLAPGFLVEEREFGCGLQVPGEFGEESGKGVAQLLFLAELVRAGARAARILDFLLPRGDFSKGPRQASARAP